MRPCLRNMRPYHWIVILIKVCGASCVKYIYLRMLPKWQHFKMKLPNFNFFFKFLNVSHLYFNIYFLSRETIRIRWDRAFWNLIPRKVRFCWWNPSQLLRLQDMHNTQKQQNTCLVLSWKASVLRCAFLSFFTPPVASALSIWIRFLSPWVHTLTVLCIVVVTQWVLAWDTPFGRLTRPSRRSVGGTSL